EKYYPSITRRLSDRTTRIDFRACLPCDTPEIESDPQSSGCQPSMIGEYQSAATFPLVLNKENLGRLRLRSMERNYFTKNDMELFKNLTQVLGIALVHRHIQVDLRERVKELTCLYEIARLGAQPSLSLEEILQGIVEILPPAWLYPETTSARIILDGRSYSTPCFQEGSHQLRAKILTQGEEQGLVEVTYRGKKTELDEGPFLKEERSLIDAVSKEVAIILKRRKDEEEKFRLEEQLRHADRLATIGQLAAGVAHELNEPLGSILGFAQLAKKCPGIPWQAGQDIEKILNASLYAREIVKKLLIFARQMPPKKIQVNLNEIINEALYLFESRCAREGIELVRSFSSELPEVYADPAQINQVLVNLVVNALQSMPEGGQLSIQTFNRGDNVSLIVEDTGTGMTEEILNKIFTPFFTTKDVGQGTGLGLPVVHGIVTAHGGSIHVESKVDQGTRFEIHLPVRGLQEAKEKSGDGLSS
ncbi:MAG TPA: ATP-binding protein, partial [Thermodesulfobacteriota bacterium]|nr:ATP-binding protein [Thermodesulfobacteriota bacterium]